MIHLPGRDMDEEDHEARHALSTLFEAEEIKMDDDLLTRVAGEISRKQSILSRISEIIGDAEPEEENQESTMQTFMERLAASQRDEKAKTDETPNERRLRISEGKMDKMIRSKVLVNFS